MQDPLYEQLIKPITDLYGDIELDLIKNIANKFDTYDSIGGSLDWYLQKMYEMGALNQENVKTIASRSKRSKREIESMLEEAGYDRIDKTGVKTLENSISIQTLLSKAVKDTDNIMKLINTKALESSNKAYMKILNKAYAETSSGIYSYNESIKRALIGMAEEGIKGATYKRNGKIVEYSLEGTVRRDVLTKTRQTANDVSLRINEELGIDLVYVSQHLGAREEHEVWQGQVYSVSGNSKKYKSLIEETGYGTITGLGGVNCRHYMTTYIEGVTKIPSRIETAENDRVYGLQQEQRALERDIRTNKKRYEVAKVIDDTELTIQEKQRLEASERKLNEFVDKNKELKRDYSKTQTIEQQSKKAIVSDKIQQQVNVDYEKMLENRNYIDVTKDWKEEMKLNINKDEGSVHTPKIGDIFSYKGVDYIVDNRKVVADHDEEELRFAKWLTKKFREDVDLLPRIKGDFIQTPDYIFKNEYWDLKTLSSNNYTQMFDNIKKKEKQSSNFIFDLSNTEIKDVGFIKGVNDIFHRDKTKFVNKVIVKKKQKFYVFQRK